MITFDEKDMLAKKLDAILAPLKVATLAGLYQELFGEPLPLIKRGENNAARGRRVWLGKRMSELGWDRIQVGWEGNRGVFEYRLGGTTTQTRARRTMRNLVETGEFPDDRIDTILRFLRIAQRTDPRVTKRFLEIQEVLGEEHAEDDGVQEAGSGLGGGGAGEPAAEQADHGPHGSG